MENADQYNQEMRYINGKLVPVIKIDPSKVHAEITKHEDGREDVKLTLPRLKLFGQPKSIK